MAIRTRSRLARFVFIAGIAGTALVAYGSVRQFLTMYRPNVGMVGDIGVLGYGYLLPAIIALYLASQIQRRARRVSHLRRAFFLVTISALTLDLLFLIGGSLNASLVGYQRVVALMSWIGILEAVVGGLALSLQVFFIGAFAASLIERPEQEA